MSYQHNLLKNSQRYYQSQQQGAVIIIALFIVALAATLAYTMMTRLARDVEQTGLIIHNIQAELYAQGGVAWAKDVLTQNWEKQQVDKIIDKTPINSPLDEVHGYEITSTIYDAQSGFNINNLLDPDVQNNFQRLLKIVIPDLTPEQILQLTQAIVDWINPSLQENAYSRYYLSLSVPYRAAHRPLLTLSELSLVRGMKPEWFIKLIPYFATLPTSVKTNIQSATIPVLMTLSKTMTNTAAKSLQEWLAQAQTSSKEKVLNLEIISNNQISGDNIILVSQFFLLVTRVKIGEQQLTLYTLLERLVNEKKALVNIIWQSKNLAP